MAVLVHQDSQQVVARDRVAVGRRRGIDIPSPAGGVVIQVDGVSQCLCERLAVGAEVDDLNADQPQLTLHLGGVAERAMLPASDRLGGDLSLGAILIQSPQWECAADQPGQVHGRRSQR